MKTANYIGTKVIFQDPDGLWPIEGKRLTDGELEKLMAIQSGTGWILITNHGVIHSNDETLLDKVCGKLSEQTLRKIAEEKPMDQEAMIDIKTATLNLKSNEPIQGENNR